MYHSIGEVANMTGLTISTLRYYDREGMFPEIGRSNGGIRVFSEKEIATLRVIACLKTAGMPIKDIKEFLNWCEEGDASLQKRRNLFYNRLEEIENQIAMLEKTKNTLRYKCWYYDTAIAAGTEHAVKNLSEDAVPEDLRDFRI